MPQDTNVENLIINKLTRAQYESIANPDPTQLYFITDDNGLSSLDDISLSNVTNGQTLKYNSTTQKWENSAAGGDGTWGSITGTLSDQTDLQDVLNNKQDKLTAGSNISIVEGQDGWAQATQVSNLGNHDWKTLAYDGSKFVALGRDGYVSTSTDGTTWSQAVQNENMYLSSWGYWETVTYDGTKFVALAHTGYVSTSTDGTTWTTPVQKENMYLDSAGYWSAITYDGTKFVVLSNNGHISTSTNGTTWANPVQDEDMYLDSSGYWSAITYDGTKFVALAHTGYVSTSTDGTTWATPTFISNLENHDWKTLAYDGSKFVALGWDGYVSTSTDGTTWSQAVQDSNLDEHNWTALAYDGSNLVALGRTGYISRYLHGSGLIISASPTWGSITGTLSSQTDLQNALNGKQAKLVSGTNIKKINNQSLLGSGNLVLDGLPSQTGQSGKFLTTNGSAASWATVNALPSQSGNSGKFLTTNGTDASWSSDVQKASNLVTSVSSSSTDSQYPSAKLFYDTIGDIEILLDDILGN